VAFHSVASFLHEAVSSPGHISRVRFEKAKKKIHKLCIASKHAGVVSVRSLRTLLAKKILLTILGKESERPRISQEKMKFLSSPAFPAN